MLHACMCVVVVCYAGVQRKGDADHANGVDVNGTGQDQHKDGKDTGSGSGSRGGFAFNLDTSTSTSSGNKAADDSGFTLGSLPSDLLPQPVSTSLEAFEAERRRSENQTGRCLNANGLVQKTMRRMQAVQVLIHSLASNLGTVTRARTARTARAKTSRLGSAALIHLLLDSQHHQAPKHRHSHLALRPHLAVLVVPALRD